MPLCSCPQPYSRRPLHLLVSSFAKFCNSCIQAEVTPTEYLGVGGRARKSRVCCTLVRGVFSRDGAIRDELEVRIVCWTKSSDCSRLEDRELVPDTETFHWAMTGCAKDSDSSTTNENSDGAGGDDDGDGDGDGNKKSNRKRKCKRNRNRNRNNKNNDNDNDTTSLATGNGTNTSTSSGGGGAAA